MSQAVQTGRASERGEGSKAKNAVMLGAVVLLLGVAAYLTFRGDAVTRQSDDAADATPYLCLECRHAFSLTPAGYVKLHEEGGVPKAAGPDADVALLRCPKCQKFAGARAFLCPNDGTSVPGRDKNKRPGRCPKCNWTPIGP